MTLMIEQRNDLDASAVPLTSLISDHQADIGEACAAAPVGPAPVRAGAHVTRIAVARAQTPPACVTTSPQAS